jgi:hypothetical protein
VSWLIDSTPRWAVFHHDIVESRDIFVLKEACSHHLVCNSFIHEGLLKMVVVRNNRALVLTNDHIGIQTAGFIWITDYSTLDKLLDVWLSTVWAESQATLALPTSSIHRPLNEYHTSRGGFILHGSVLLILHDLANAFDVYVPLVCPLSVLLVVVARLYDCLWLIVILIWHNSAIIHAAVVVVLPPGCGTSIFHEGQLLCLHWVIKQSFVKMVVIADPNPTLIGNRLRKCGLG